jgi:alpha-ketoglutarate-dependent taurine dioxygenase
VNALSQADSSIATPMTHDPYAHTSQTFAWKAADFSGFSDYCVHLDDDDRAAIAVALAPWERGGREVPVAELPKDAFAGAALGAKLAEASAQVRAGRGFVILRGLPVAGIDIGGYSAAVWLLGQHFGFALSQNAQGERLTHVIDATAEDPTPRMYRSNMELRPHTDITAMISLAAWNKSASGGASVVASAVTVHDEIRRRAPELLAPLYRGYHYHRLGEGGADEAEVTEHRVPIFANRNGQLSCRYLRSGVVGGHRALGLPLAEEDLAAMNLFDEISTAPENRLAFFLERGDMMVVNNYTVMHARTRFTNFPEPERRRQLVRLWLDAEAFRDVPREFNFFRTNGVPLQEGKRATYDFKKLYANDPVATGGVADLKVTDAEAAATR